MNWTARSQSHTPSSRLKSLQHACVWVWVAKGKKLTPSRMTSITLLWIIISHHKSLLSGWFSISPRWDMLGPWRVYSFKRNLRFPSDVLWFPYDSHGTPSKLYAEANGIFVLLDHRPNHLHSPQKHTILLHVLHLLIQRHCRIWSGGCVQIK